MQKVTEKSKSRWVYTTGLSKTDTALSGNTKMAANERTEGRSRQLESRSRPLPSQVLTFQRGMAKAAIEKVDGERGQILALSEVLSMMGIHDRFYNLDLYQEGGE